MKVVVCTGGFDPLHSGHVKYLESAAKLGDTLLVGVNSDQWLIRKKGQPFMPWQERASVVQALKGVDRVEPFNDSDGSACDLLAIVKRQYPYAKIIFANGGDRTSNNIPEMDVAGIEFVFGVGGENKANSSSWILQEWKTPKVARPWGWYRVLYEQPGTKVKELVVEPMQSLSMQRHNLRAERWHVVSGQAVVNSVTDGGYQLPGITIGQHGNFDLEAGQWHQLTNPFGEPCRVIEIQYGSDCRESDIERIILERTKITS